MKNTKIAWAHHTFNAWRGCNEVSPACDNCYARTMSLRNPAALGVWGAEGTRIIAEPSQWLEVLRWNDECFKTGERQRVFVNSLSDTFEQWDGTPTFTNGSYARRIANWDNGGKLPFTKVTDAKGSAKLDDIREYLMWLVLVCQNLDFLFLTKRPKDMGEWMQREYDLSVERFPNLWLGVTVENRDAYWRIDELRKINAEVRFVSVEPMLEDLRKIDLTGIDWAICGGESAKGRHDDGTPKLRPMKSLWATNLRDECRRQNVRFFFKQWGNALPVEQRDSLAYSWEKLGCEPVVFDNSKFFVLSNKDDTGRLLDGVEHLAVPVSVCNEVPA